MRTQASCALSLCVKFRCFYSVGVRGPHAPPLKSARGKSRMPILVIGSVGRKYFARSKPASRRTRYQRRRDAGTGPSTGRERVERVFVNCQTWAACRSRQPARPIQLIARNPLPNSRSEAVSPRRIHSGLWPEIRRLLSGTHPSWTFATPLQTQMQTINAKSLAIVPGPPALW